MSSALDQVAAELDDDVIVVAQDVGDPSGNPSKWEKRQLVWEKMHREDETESVLAAYFFITWRLTFCVSTFWLKIGGNFVLLRSFASTPVAMAGNRGSCV